MNNYQRYLIRQHKIDMIDYGSGCDVEGAYNTTISFLRELINTDKILKEELDDENRLDELENNQYE